MGVMKVIEMIDKHYDGDRNLVAQCAGVSTVQQVNNWVSENRDVLELKNGGYVLLSDKVKIIKKP